MIITCNKQVLLNNINIVMKSVATRTTMPILECILIIADRDGLRLIANDLELGIETANITAEIIELGSIALKANIFADIIRNMPSEDVTINVDNNHFTTITGDKTEFTIAGQNGDEFPQINKIQKDNKYTIKSRIFSNMIKQTKFSVSLDETKPMLTGELLEIKNEQFNIVAADYSRVSFRKSFIELEHNQDLKQMEVVVPARTLTEIIKILPDKGEDLLNIYFNENQILFEIESCIIVSRLIEGDFLKYEPIFTEDHTTKIKISKLELLDSLKRATLVTRDSKKTVVRLNINSDERLIITANAELGNSKEELKVDLQGQPLSISFNPKYLIDALRVIDDEMIFIQFMSPLSPCIIKPIETDEFKYLILPLRV